MLYPIYGVNDNGLMFYLQNIHFIIQLINIKQNKHENVIQNVNLSRISLKKSFSLLNFHYNCCFYVFFVFFVFLLFF